MERLGLEERPRNERRVRVKYDARINTNLYRFPLANFPPHRLHLDNV